MKFLLDTATFWWIASGSERLPQKVADIYADSANDIALSPVSIWELLVKHQIGKLPTPVPLVELITRAREEQRLRSVPVTDPRSCGS